MAFNANMLINDYGGQSAPSANVPQYAPPQFPDGRTMAAKPGDWGSVLGGVADVMEKEKERSMKMNMHEAEMAIKQADFDLKKAAQAYEQDPTNPANQANFATAKLNAAKARKYDAVTNYLEGEAGGGTQQQSVGGSTGHGQNSLMGGAPGGAAGGDPRRTAMLDAAGLKVAAGQNRDEAKSGRVFQERTDKNLADDVQGWNKDYSRAGTRARDSLRSIRIAEQINKTGITGAFSTHKAWAIKAGRAVGMDKEVAALLNENTDQPAKIEAFQSIVKAQMVGMIGGKGEGEAGFASSGFSDRDSRILEATTAKADNSPEGNAIILRIARAKAEREIARGNEYNTWRKKNPRGTKDDFTTHWAKLSEKHTLDKELQADIETFLAGGEVITKKKLTPKQVQTKQAIENKYGRPPGATPAPGPAAAPPAEFEQQY